MKHRRLLALGLATVTLMSTTMGVSAMDLKDIFDAEYYAEQNPDVKEAIGDDAKALYQHYVTSGLAEGRNGSPVLDVAEYRASYSDLEKAFGDNWEAYVDHYFANGVYEANRRKGVLLDPIVYGESYRDLRKAFGTDIVALTKHYVSNGWKEGRDYGTAGKYEDIDERNAYDEEAALLRKKAWQAENRPGVDKDTMDGMVKCYKNAADAYIAYYNSTTKSDKKANIKLYMDWMNSFVYYKKQVDAKGIQSQVEEMYELIDSESDRVLDACPNAKFHELPYYLVYED